MGATGLPLLALGAAGSSPVPRARRLARPYQPLRRVAVDAIAAMVIGTIAAPLTLASLPVGPEISHDCCAVATGRGIPPTMLIDSQSPRR